MSDERTPSYDDCQTADEVLDWLRLAVIDLPGARDDVEHVRELLQEVMRRRL